MRGPICQYKRYIWQLPVRITHWVNVVAIVVIAVTGLYIGSPKTLALDPSGYVMGWVRFVHFSTGYAFAVSVASRIYWAFAGNKYASWKAYFPAFTAEGRRHMKEMFRYYFFLTREVPETEGHNPLAATAYAGIHLLYLVMIGTGFAIYSEFAPHSIMHKSLGWMFAIASSQQIRLIHHGVMWLILAFVCNHVYSAWLMDAKEHGGEVSSIFSGYKFMLDKEKQAPP